MLRLAFKKQHWRDDVNLVRRTWSEGSGWVCCSKYTQRMIVVRKTTILGGKFVHNLASTCSQGTWMSHAKGRKGIWPKRHHTVSLRSPVSFWQMISLHSFIPLLQRWLLIWVKGSREGGIDWETLAWWKRKDSPWGPLAGVVCLVWISYLHQGPLTISPPLSNIILQTDGCLCFLADEEENWGAPQCSGNLDLCWILECLGMVMTITFQCGGKVEKCVMWNYQENYF